MRHRVHAALVHFPVACWTIAALLLMTTALTGLQQVSGIELQTGAAALVWTGVVSAVLAAIAGLAELLDPRAGAVADSLISRHMAMAGCAWLCFLLSGLALTEAVQLPRSEDVAWISATLGLVFLIAAGHFGNHLVIARRTPCT